MPEKSKRKYPSQELEACRIRMREWRAKNRDRYTDYHRRYWLEKNYGITSEQYDEMVEEQDNLCAICGRTCDIAGRLSVDHCHDSGKVRGLLCRKCNSGLGFFREDPVLLTKAAVYLETA